jgi:hypothetical protein
MPSRPPRTTQCGKQSCSENVENEEQITRSLNAGLECEKLAKKRIDTQEGLFLTGWELASASCNQGQDADEATPVSCPALFALSCPSPRMPCIKDK